MKNLVYLIIAFLILGCTHDAVNNELKRAESVIDEHPDSANAILEGIDAGSLRGGESRALHALLLTRARSKLKTYDTNDSLIDIAVDYYGESDNLNSCMSNFYKGEVNFNAGNYRTAIAYATTALYIAGNLGDDYWQARSHDLIADIYQLTYGVDEALSSRRRAAELFHRAGRRDNELYDYIVLADCLSGAKWQYEETLVLLDSVKPLTEGMDSDMIACYLESYIRPLYRLGRNEEALDYYYRYLKYKTIPGDWTPYENIAEIYFKIGNEDSMIHYLERARENPNYMGNANYHRVLNDIAYAKGDIDSAYKELVRSNAVEQHATDSALRQEIALLQRDEFSQKARYERERSREIVLYSAIGLILLGAVSLLVVINYRQRLRMKDMELREKASESALLMDEVEETRIRLSHEQDTREEMERRFFRERDEKDATVRRLFREQFSAIDGILSEYYSKRDAPGMRARIADDLDRAISTIGSADKLSELEEIINRYNDGVIAKLREQISPVDERSVSVLTLFAAGFSLRSISLITGINTGNINNLWYRLKKRVTDSSAPDRDLILSLFRR